MVTRGLSLDAGFGAAQCVQGIWYQLDGGPVILARPNLGLVWSPELRLSYLAQTPAGEPARALAPGLEWRP